MLYVVSTRSRFRVKVIRSKISVELTHLLRETPGFHVDPLKIPEQNPYQHEQIHSVLDDGAVRVAVIRHGRPPSILRSFPRRRRRRIRRR